MRKPIITKYCRMDTIKDQKELELEEKLEQFLEKKIDDFLNKLMEDPSNVTIIKEG